MVYYKRLKSVIYPFFISIMALLTIGLFFSGCSTEKTASDPSAPRSEPGAPEWVAATDGEYSNKIAITWQGVPTAETYGVYRSTAFNGTYTKIAEKLTGTSYEDNAVAADTHYFYKVEGCNGLYDPAVSAYDTGFAGNYPVISDATLGAHMKSILAKVLLKVYTGDVVLYMFPITVHGIIGGTAVASIKLAYEDGPLIITIVFTQYNDYGYAINGTIVQNLSFIGLDGTATGTLTVSGADTTTVEYHVAITSDGESHPKENGGYYILTTGSGSPQWIDWTNPDVLAANEQLYYQEVLRPIILDVWAQIVDKDFVFPITLNGDAGAMDSNKEIFYDNGNPIGLRVTNTYIGYTKGDTIISGTQFIDLDDKMIGDETGTISVTGANTATVEFHVTIGPRGDGHSIENGGYYMISLNGGASVRVEWVAPPLPGVPPGVAATDGEYYDRIVVSWGSVDDANHYEVQRASGSGDGIYYTIAEKVSSDTSYSDTTAVEGIDYYYRVRTVNENGSSEYSTYNKGTIKIDPVAPDAPTTISASKGIVDGKVIISWNVVPRANFYRVYRANTVSGAYAVINGFVTVASCEDTTVADKTLYYYRVTSVNEYGESDLSSKFDYGYPGSGYTPPDAPAGVSATDGTEYNKVTITWNGVGTDLNETDYYRVYRSAAIDGEYVQVGADITDTGTYPDSYTFYDSTVYRTSRYYYKVKAFNNYGGSDYSSADQGYGEITVEQFYSIFVDTVNYVNAKIYAEFDYPWIGDEKTFSGDVGGSFYFRVHSAWFQLYATINYSSLDEGDLDPNTTGDSSGMILNGSVEKKTGIITGNGAQTGTVTVTGDLAGTCVYNLEIKGGSVSGGYTRVTYNGDTTDISY